MRHIEINKEWSSRQPFTIHTANILHYHEGVIDYGDMVVSKDNSPNPLLNKIWRGKQNDISMEEIGLTKDNFPKEFTIPISDINTLSVFFNSTLTPKEREEMFKKIELP